MTDEVLELVLGKLDGVRQQGGYWMAQCPAHEDSKASLSVGRGTSQPVVVNCHAGCEAAVVLEAIGLTLADVSAPRGQADMGSYRRDPITAVYDYTDERGKLLFQVCRTVGKQFPQRRPDPGDSSGWAWNLKGVSRVPYHLQQVKKAARGPVAGRVAYVVEGEKDVHAIEAAGGVATCNPGGAGKWRPEYSKHLAGIREVIIVADKDEPGRKHADQVAESLRSTRGVLAARIRIVEAAAGKDAADHLAAGFGLSDFRDLAAEAPPMVSVVETKKEERTKSAGPPVPSADPVMFAGVLGEITMAAVPTTEADPVGIYRVTAGRGRCRSSGPAPTSRSATPATRC